MASRATLTWDGSGTSVTTLPEGYVEATIDNYFLDNSEVLYDNATGVAGTVTLSKSAANNKYLEIFYGRNSSGRYVNSNKVQDPDGKTVDLGIIHPTSDTTINIQLYAETITISGTSITINQGNSYGLSHVAFANWQRDQRTSAIVYIYKVIGYY